VEAPTTANSFVLIVFVEIPGNLFIMKFDESECIAATTETLCRSAEILPFSNLIVFAVAFSFCYQTTNSA